MSGEPVEIKVAQSTMDLAAEAMREAVAELTRLRAENATLQSQALQMAEAIGRVDEWAKEEHRRQRVRAEKHSIVGKSMMFLLKLVRGELAGEDGEVITIATAVREASHD